MDKWLKKWIKRIIFFSLILYVAVHFLGFDITGTVSAAKTVVLDTVEKLFPGSRKQFENIDAQISGTIAKSGVARTLNNAAKTATTQAKAFFGTVRRALYRFAARFGLNLDDLFRPRRYSGGATSSYSFDYNTLDMTQASSLRQSFIDYSMTLRGTPFVLGGETPESGLDCSSFVRYAAKNGLGVQLPRTAREQYAAVERISKSDLEPGDLVFFRYFGKIDHVGIYLGRYSGSGSLNGREIFINAASKGPRTGVVVSALDEPYWRRHYSSSGRFLPSSQDAADAMLTKE